MTSPQSCSHEDVDCLNQYELIRKYRCRACGCVIMCGCDEARGRRFHQHQLDEGVELETQRRIPVTDGFQPRICSECRGLGAVSAPTAEVYGRTSKIQRYYWRELQFMTDERLADWMDAHPEANTQEERKRVQTAVLAELQHLHQTQPKYVFNDLSQDEVIKRYGVEVERFDAVYLAGGGKGRLIDDGKGGCSAEEFVISRYEEVGWNGLKLESKPFHVLFGVFTWLLIQDSTSDAHIQIVRFGERLAYEERREAQEIWTHLPDDFGTKGYTARRAKEIEDHFADLAPDRDELLWHFDYWLDHSSDFRNYLWAHRRDDVDRARRLIELLEPENIIAILRYLLDDYWGHYLGWPDLLLYRDDGAYFLAEVKSSNDKLSEDQKRWIADNHDWLKLPFKLVKVHRPSMQQVRRRK
jgi:hypothetical protein